QKNKNIETGRWPKATSKINRQYLTCTGTTTSPTDSIALDSLLTLPFTDSLHLQDLQTDSIK
ncbi:MAG TPA: hypothetical protein PLO59_06395, partial [Bacteroidia bacterium]|nr:hypothetical protein [Bacteroidia bacterium]